MVVSDRRQRLRHLPAIGALLDSPASQPLISEFSRARLAWALQEVVSAWRRRILAGEDLEPSPQRARDEALDRLNRPYRLVRVVNATGVVLNTNLGRAPLPVEILAHAAELGSGYCNLEFNLERGERGDRHSHLEDALARLCGAEAAIAVNNNAAAVLLVVDTLARGKEVLVSRGELVEIGGSFRIPDVIRSAGAGLCEVGTTNKTRLEDFERGVSERTALILKCHRSNFKMEGFIEDVPSHALADLAHRQGLPFIEDLGSGTLVDLVHLGLPHEPTVAESVASGLDLVTFSGDKLLGGPQAGLIVGKRSYVDMLKKNPLLRALRIDKTILAMLEATLVMYLGSRSSEIPALAMLSAPLESLRTYAESLSARLCSLGAHAQAVSTSSMPGGGSLPGVTLPTWAVRLECPSLSAQALADRLRTGSLPVIGRICDDAVLLDVRTMLPQDDDRVATAVAAILAKVLA